MQSSLDASLIDRAERAARTSTAPELTAEYAVSSWALGAADVRVGWLTANSTTPQFASIGEGPALELGNPEVKVATGRQAKSLRTIRAGDQRYRVVAVPTRDPGVALVIAQSLDSQERVLGRLGVVMLLFGLLGVVTAGAAGWAVARNGLRPVRRLTARVEHIARTEDLTPIAVEGNDEIARLSSAFNTMLAALEASRDRQRQLVGDAGHELRTPLTSLRTNLDLLLMADEAGGMAPEARAELLADVQAQIEEMTQLIGDLVELGRDEHAPHQVELVDLKDVLERTVARVRRRASSLTFDIEAEDWWVTGESAALERAVMNLLDNAAKWSPPEGTVTVQLVDGVLTVSDQGPGISEADLPHVFDRFYRSTESRSMPGSGLGLSIVRATAVRHSGSVVATNLETGGACLTMSLPGRTLQQS